MISALLFSVVVSGSMYAFYSFQRKGQQSDAATEFAVEAQQVSQLLVSDIRNAAYLSGTTTIGGTNFQSTKTYGILPQPFADSSSLTSDGIQLFVIMSTLSTSSLFDLSTITPGGTCGSIVVSGDFSPTQTLAEDLFVMVSGSAAELFKVSGTISVSGSVGSQLSTVTLDSCSNTAIAEMQTALLTDPTNVPKIYRVQRIRYTIGNGVATTGLYRYSNGQTVLISDHAASMQIRYGLLTTDSTTSADCASKTNSRWFAHATTSAQCNWNEVVAIHAEIVLESAQDLAMPANFNPHIPSVVDGKVRYISHISAMPSNYTGAS
ncbi:MAG: hypothetical protein J0L93_11065 [Deltaproteobacteria bacterium]|nr:hypothetical protein [Deltaproteobacteria bacterium]